MKPTPILVTTLSYDTSTYNDSTNQSDYNDEDIGEVYAEEELVSKLQNTPPMISLPTEVTTPPTIKSMKKKGVVTQTLIAKIPIVLQNNSDDEVQDQREDHGQSEEKIEVEPGEYVEDEQHQHIEVEKSQNPDLEQQDNIEIEQSEKVEVEKSENVEDAQESELEESEDVFDETSLSKSNEAIKEAAAGSGDFRLQYPWTRSDTFDVIPVSQSSHIAVPVKPKRGVVSPLQSQRHPTERDDTMGDITQIEKAPLQRLPAENTEHFSDQSSFSQVSSNRSSSFDYEVQYIMPQLSTGDPLIKTEEEETTEKISSTDKDTSSYRTMQDETNSEMNEDGKNCNLDNSEITVRVSEASNSENEDESAATSQ